MDDYQGSCPKCGKELKILGSRPTRSVATVAEPIRLDIRQGSSSREKPIWFMVFLCGLVLPTVPLVVFYTLKTDSIYSAHTKEIANKDAEIQFWQSRIHGKTTRLRESEQDLGQYTNNRGSANELGGLRSKYEPPIPLEPVNFSDDWNSLSAEKQRAARHSEIRRIFGLADMSGEECDKKYGGLSFSKKLQMEAGLTGDPMLKEAVWLHQIVQLNSLGSRLLKAIFDVDKPDVSSIQSLITDENHQKGVWDKMRRGQVQISDEEVWKRFGELSSLEMIQTLLDITRDFVLGKIETIIKRSRPDFPQEASFRDGPFDPHKVLTAVGMSSYRSDSAEEVFSFISMLVWNRFEQYPQ